MIDRLIMEAVFRDEKALGVQSLKPLYLVGTGVWNMVEFDDHTYISFTDEYIGEQTFTVMLLSDCELVEGEKLVMFTSVSMDKFEYSLVLFKENVVKEESEGSDVNAGVS